MFGVSIAQIDSKVVNWSYAATGGLHHLNAATLKILDVYLLRFIQLGQMSLFTDRHRTVTRTF
jgi:hypothetical protein